MHPAIPRRSPARVETLWMAAATVGIWVVFVGFQELRYPAWNDREYELRLEALNDRLAERPNDPVCAVLGSSRTGLAFNPSELPPIHDAAGRTVLPFNFSHFGAGPRINRINLHRLFRAGADPKWVVVELTPAHVGFEAITGSIVSAADVPVALPFEGNQPEFLWEFTRRRLNACYQNRTPFLRTFAPPFVTTAGDGDEMAVGPLGDDEVMNKPGADSDDHKERQYKLIKKMYAGQVANLHFDPHLVEATRTLLAECRDRGIPIALLIAPEDSRFRAWYGPGVEERIQMLFNGLADEFDVPFVDARGWVSEDEFLDPHHLTAIGARHFTLKLGTDVIQPMALGKWPADVPRRR